jgi:hypothetical protein
MALIVSELTLGCNGFRLEVVDTSSTRLLFFSFSTDDVSLFPPAIGVTPAESNGVRECDPNVVILSLGIFDICTFSSHFTAYDSEVMGLGDEDEKDGNKFCPETLQIT